MTQRQVWFVCLLTAGLLQCGIAFAHFGLQYEWRGVDGGSLPAQLRWALFALNFSWSVVVLVIGVLMLYAARLNSNAPFVRATVFSIGLFWTIHAIYMVVMPMPVPARLAWIQGPIVAFPITVVLLQWLPWVATRNQSESQSEIPRAGASVSAR
jgi:hypothetical protein